MKLSLQMRPSHRSKLRPQAKTSPVPVRSRAGKRRAMKVSGDADAAVVAGAVVEDEAASKPSPRRSAQRLRRELFPSCLPKQSKKDPRNLW